MVFVCTYQNFVAACLGLVAIPSMDQACFVSSSKANVNVMNCIYIDKKISREDLVHNCMKAAIHLPTMRYCVETVGGDYYYREMSMEEAMSKAVLFNTDPKRILRSWGDVDRFV